MKAASREKLFRFGPSKIGLFVQECSESSFAPRVLDFFIGLLGFGWLSDDCEVAIDE